MEPNGRETATVEELDFNRIPPISEAHLEGIAKNLIDVPIRL